MVGDDVKFVQTKLKEYGFYNGKIDGVYGKELLEAVINFQKKVNINPDGIIGKQTWDHINNYKSNNYPNNQQIKNNLNLKPYYVGSNGLVIYDYLLSDDEYIKEETHKDTIYLHHTGGGSRPDWTINGWQSDYTFDKKGNKIKIRVATHYVIGRKSSSTGDETWDGVILRAFDDKYWAYHLGITGNKNKELNSKSISIEICNYGQLTLGKDGRFYNYVNKPVMESEVVELDKPFRGYKYFERYTDKQIESLRKLILYLKDKWDIKIEKNIYNEHWFEYNDKWFSSGGLRTHVQVRKDKLDLFPQKEMIQMLNSL